MGTSFYEAPCLDVLERELNVAHPERDRRSDGWIGDTSHAARPSDHNPDWNDGGVVRARDIDKDGPDMAKLLHILLNDDRVEYVIWRGQIWSRIRNFRSIPYKGVNGHFEHIHVSIRHGKKYENDTRPWGYNAPQAKPTPAKLPPKKENTMFLAKHPGNDTQFLLWGGPAVALNRFLFDQFVKAGVPQITLQSLDQVEAFSSAGEFAVLRTQNAALAAQIKAMTGVFQTFATNAGSELDVAALLTQVEAAANKGAQEALDSRIDSARVELDVN